MNKNDRINPSPEIDVLHGAAETFPLYYNGSYDLGKYLLSAQEDAVQKPDNTDTGSFLPAKMNITKNQTSPIEKPKPRRKFWFINR